MRASDTFRHHAKMTSQLHPLWGQLPEGFTFLVGQAVSPARSFSDSEAAGETACPTKTARQSISATSKWEGYLLTSPLFETVRSHAESITLWRCDLLR